MTLHCVAYEIHEHIPTVACVIHRRYPRVYDRVHHRLRNRHPPGWGERSSRNLQSCSGFAPARIAAVARQPAPRQCGSHVWTCTRYTKRHRLSQEYCCKPQTPRGVEVSVRRHKLGRPATYLTGIKLRPALAGGVPTRCPTPDLGRSTRPSCRNSDS